jgi:hypothetical protein
MDKKELRPAMLILTKRGKRTRYLFFEDHNNAWDLGEAFRQSGWHWEMHVVEVYRQGEFPDDMPAKQKALL